jgi:hypothetical protein
MAEPTLSLSKTEIDDRIAKFLGHKSGTANRTTEENADVNECRQDGLRRFYRSHSWRFLTPDTTLSTGDGTQWYTLPDDFASLASPFTFGADDGYVMLEQTSVTEIRDLKAASDVDGVMRKCAIRPQGGSGTDGQRWEVGFYPTPDNTYTLEYRYRRNPNDLTTAAPYPLGGALYSEAILECCLAEAELHKDDEYGIHNQKYVQEALPAAIRRDGETQPRNIGTNSDNSDHGYWLNVRESVQSLYNGQTYD